jgi:plastocyanin
MRRIIPILLAGAIALAGCGGDDEDEPAGAPAEGGGGESLTLTADPGGALAWDPGELSAAAGSVSIELVNDSATPHAVEVEGNGVEEESETVTGASTTLTVDLEPGEYTFYCPVGNHRGQGMEGTLTVQ